MDGGMVSRLWTFAIHEFVFPQISSTVKVTCEIPQPEIVDGLAVIDLIPQLSVEPPSIKFGEMEALQLSFKTTPIFVQMATGRTMSFAITGRLMLSLQAPRIAVKQTLNTPQSVNVCTGFDKLEVLLLPLPGSSKFQL